MLSIFFSRLSHTHKLTQTTHMHTLTYTHILTHTHILTLSHTATQTLNTLNTETKAEHRQTEPTLFLVRQRERDLG